MDRGPAACLARASARLRPPVPRGVRLSFLMRRAPRRPRGLPTGPARPRTFGAFEARRAASTTWGAVAAGRAGVARGLLNPKP
jgi:hypothetical protein